MQTLSIGTVTVDANVSLIPIDHKALSTQALIDPQTVCILTRWITRGRARGVDQFVAKFTLTHVGGDTSSELIALVSMANWSTG